MPVVRFTTRLAWNISTVRGAMSINNFHMDSGTTTPDTSNAALVADKIIALYKTDLDGLWGSVLAGSVEVIATNLADLKPRTAFYYAADTITPEASTLPGEVAAKVHYKAPRESGVHAQKFRGTLHLGPLYAGALNTGGHLSNATVDQITGAFDNFVTAVGTSAYDWVVGSEASAAWKRITTLHFSNECGTVGRRQFPETYAGNLDV